MIQKIENLKYFESGSPKLLRQKNVKELEGNQTTKLLNKINSFLCIPIIINDGNVLGVVQIANKTYQGGVSGGFLRSAAMG